VKKHAIIFKLGITLTFLGGVIMGWTIGARSSNSQGASGVWIRLEPAELGRIQVREIVNGGDVITNLSISVSVKP